MTASGICSWQTGGVRLGGRDLDPADPYAEPNLLLRGLGGAEFEEVRPAGGTLPVLMAASRGAAFGDLDNDGADDVVIVNKDGPVHVLRNEVGTKGHWVGLDVRDARGAVARNAVVGVERGERRWVRQVQPNEAYGSSHDPRLIFGLGASTDRVEAEVRWADGAVERFGPLTLGQYHVLTRGRGQPADGSVR